MKRILVADDSVTIQKVIALTFADEPFDVESVGTGSDALERIKEVRPDIVLADVIMPQMNGYELCKAIKEQPDTSSIPVLLLAGTFEAFDEGEAKAAQADDYITKPFESGELIDKVKGLVGDTTAVAAAPDAPSPAVQLEEAPVPVALPEPSITDDVEVISPEEKPVEIDRTPPVEQPQVPEPVQQPSPPEAPQATPAAEPDIWDILSEGDVMEVNGGVDRESISGVPGLSGLEDDGVVDVGSFEVGLERSVETTVQEPVPVQPEPVPAAVPEVTLPETMSEEKSKVEGREKDFFGFDVEDEGSGADILDGAIEEVSFALEEPGPDAGSPQAVSKETSFIVPEPALDEPVPGETIAPEAFQPEPPVSEMQPSEPLTVPEPIAEAVSTEPEIIPDPIFDPGLVEPLPVIVPEADEPAVRAPVMAEADSLPQAVDAPAPGLSADLIMDDEVRRIIEEKVEKIAWEVVPEMAEVLIKEAIEKIKGGT
jgi:CheY-like chemotaxis protein